MLLQPKTKKSSLTKVAEEIKKCKICPLGKSGLPVPGDCSPDAEVVFIGEAPGKEEAKVGRPFVGRSGKLLRSLIVESGLAEEAVFITSPVKYLPDRGTPTSKDIKHGMIHTQKQLDIINPKIIVLLGRVAAEGVLGEKISIVKDHGKLIEKNGRKYLLAFHPAAALRFPPNKQKLTQDFKKLQNLL